MAFFDIFPCKYSINIFKCMYVYLSVCTYTHINIYTYTYKTVDTNRRCVMKRSFFRNLRLKISFKGDLRKVAILQN